MVETQYIGGDLMRKRLIAMLIVASMLSGVVSYPVRGAVLTETNAVKVETSKDGMDYTLDVAETNELGYTLVVRDKADYISEDGSVQMKYIPRETVIYETEQKQEDIKRQLLKTEQIETNFFNDCSTDYGFYQFDQDRNAVGLQTLYIRMMEILIAAYDGDSDIEPANFGGTEYYCIGTAEYGSLGLTSEEVFAVYTSVLSDHPLFYYMHNTFMYDGIDVYLMMDESFVEGEKRREIAQSIESEVEEICSTIQEGSSNYEIVKSVHDKIIEEAVYAFEEDGITPKNNVYVHSIAGYVSEEREVVCDGYAKTFGAVLNYLDIENIFVTGWGVANGAETSDETAHAWNIVRLGDGKYYFVDVTWDDQGEEGAIENYLCIGQELYLDHSILSNGENGSSYYMYAIPEIAETAFTGEDSLKTVEDPIYSVINTVDYTLEDGVLTFSGRGTIVGEEDYTLNPWYIYKDEVNAIVFENGITEIGNYIFCDFDKLESITFSNGQSIGFRAFADCSALEEVTLPDNMPYAGGQIFADCENLKKVTYGTLLQEISVYYIGGWFLNDTSLEIIEVPEDNDLYEAKDNVLFIKDISLLDYYPEGKRDTVYKIPDGTKQIGNAFTNCRYLEEIVIPNTVEVVFTSAFVNCSALASLTFPDSVEQFYDDISNEGVPSIVLCESLKYIQNESDAKLYLEQGTSVVEGQSESKSYRYWKDDVTGNVVPYITNAKVVPEYFGLIMGESMAFVVDGITYWVQTSTDILSAEEISNEVPVGEVKAIDFSTPEDIDKVPNIVKYMGWNYKVIAIEIGESEEPDIEVCEHTNVKRIEVKKATCKQEGYTGDIYCLDCKTVIEEGSSISMVAHEYKETTDVATLKKDGLRKKFCSVCNKVVSKKTIYRPSKIVLSKESVVYNGKKQKPSVVVKDRAGNTIDASSYKVTYSNNTKVGTATVTVTFKGNYKGTLKKTFKITPKGTKITKLTAMKKGFLVKWSKQKKEITGYQIQYSTKKNFKNAKTVTVDKKVSKQITKLKEKQKYYVRIRTYKTVKVAGKTVKRYSAWSSPKTVKTKK